MNRVSQNPRVPVADQYMIFTPGVRVHYFVLSLAVCQLLFFVSS